MHKGKRTVLILLLAAALCGCTAAGDAGAAIRIPGGKMLHLQHVLERYDGEGNPVPQYLEIWLMKGRARCSELDADGNELAVTLDGGSRHIRYDAATLSGEKFERSALFLLNAGALRKEYPKVRESGEGEYAGRGCSFHLLETADGADWIKLYVDKGTGCVLLCDAPTFRLRTAVLEELPADEALFTEPDGLSFEGGDGK